MASSSRPSSATSSSVRWAAASGRTAGWPSGASTGRRRRVRTSGVSDGAGASRVRVVIGRAVMWWCSSDLEVDGARRGGHAGLDELALVPVDLTGAQVADLAGEQGGQAAAAD